MSKVLLSFLGTGAKNERVYKTLNYKFDSGESYDTSFMADALATYYGIDKIILVGTVKSMWEEAYSVFSIKHNLPIEDDDLLDILFELFKKRNPEHSFED